MSEQKENFSTIIQNEFIDFFEMQMKKYAACYIKSCEIQPSNKELTKVVQQFAKNYREIIVNVLDSILANPECLEIEFNPPPSNHLH